jgi:hypothetical protein
MTDAACQACHRERYHSFADGHPDFGAWPYERRTRIAFDHLSHQRKHHPAAQKEFACSSCHAADATGAWQLTRSYAESCAACHDKPLALSMAGGVPLVALPTLDLAALQAAGQPVDSWPEAADGDFDGALPASAKLLLAADPAAAAALRTLEPTFDFFDVDPEDPDELMATAAIARALKALIDDLAARRTAAIGERLAKVLGRELDAAEIAALNAGLGAEATAYRDAWFAAPPPANSSIPPAASGAWGRDETTLSLRYQPTGHADPWLRAWLDVLAEAATGPQAAVAEPLLPAALKPTAPGQCGSCHSVERDAGGRLAIQWQPFDPRLEPRGLTHFSHASHVLQSQLQDCTACHAVANTATAAGYATDNPRQFVAGFAPMTKSTCMACHAAGAARDNCTTCHRYHAGSGQWAASREQ